MYHWYANQKNFVYRGAVEVAKPARMLEDIREAGEDVPSDCEIFNANLEMSGDDVTFEEVMEVWLRYK